MILRGEYSNKRQFFNDLKYNDPSKNILKRTLYLARHQILTILLLKHIVYRFQKSNDMQVSAKRWTERVLSCVSKCFITYRLHTQTETNTVIQI